MIKNAVFRRFFLILLISSFFLFLGIGCGSKQNQAEETPPPLSTPTTTPTQAPDRVILAALNSTNSTEVTEAQAIIAMLATESGLVFEMRETIFSNDITPDVKIIVFLEQPDNLGSLAAGAPQTQFVAIGSHEWNPPANGNIIRENDDHVAFLAGYLSAMLAPNFRVGSLQISEDVQFNQAFNNGVSYYCGLCAALVYPLNTYPVVTQLPANSMAANWQTAFNEINNGKINVLFLPGGAASAELGTFLSSQDIAVIGNTTPPEELRSKWVATISTDGLAPLQEIWPDLMNGIGGKTVNASLMIADVNYINVTDGLVWLSQGKMDQLNEIIQLLREGQIYPYSVIE